MAPEFHQRVRQIFDEALERPEDGRTAFVRTACAGDTALFQAVDRLLRARGPSETFLQTAPLHTEQIGRYLIHGELGRGAMGVVYDAVDPMIGRRVAVKVISLKGGADTREAEFVKEQLFREARSAGRLFHPGIVIIFDVGIEGDSAFVTMERVDGPSLQKLLAAEGPFDPKAAFGILHQIAAALDYAHQSGVVHRDIKPANIMLHNRVTVKVADFGIAKIMSAHNTTMTGLVMGTPSYMSPEQIEAKPVDGRSDQFSLAVLAYELLSGARPFEADSVPTVVHLIVYGARPSLRAANPSFPAGMDAVLERALSRSPEQRFASCAEFTAALEAAFRYTPPVDEKPKVPDPPKVPEPAKKRKPIPLAHLAGIAALVVLAVAVVALALTSVYRKNHGFGAKRFETATAPASLPALPAAPAKSDVDRTAPPVTIPATPAAEAAPRPVDKPAPPILLPTPLPDATKAKTLPASTRGQRFYNAALVKLRDGKAQEAVGLFREAAEMGEPSAMAELAESYHTGEGVSQNDQEALRWFQRAATAGNAGAMVSLGALYLLGDIVPANDEEAARWFQKAADLNNPAGMFDLATLYENGQGVARNMDKARQLYQKSAALGNVEAQRRLAQLQNEK